MLQRLKLATCVVAVCSTALASAASSGMRDARGAVAPAHATPAGPGVRPAGPLSRGWLPPTAQHHPIVTGDLSRSLAASDLDGDGTADIVTGNELSLTVGVALSHRKGRMADIVHHPIASAADASLYRVQVAVGNLVGSRHPDIVAAGFSRNTLEVFVGQGKGRFAAPIQVALQTGDEPTSVAVGDLDHDGHQDIVTGDGLDRAVSVLFGDGKGTFSAPRRFPTGAVAGQVVVADATRDGLLDILSAGGSDGIALLAGTGKGGFAAPVLLSAGPGTSVLGLAVADATGDGRVDLVTANQDTDDGDFDAPGSVSVLPGERARGFGRAHVLSVGKETLGRVETVAVADVTGDGHPDIVAGRPVDSVLTLLAGDGARGFLDPVNVPAGGGAADPVIIADVNGDRRPDVVTSVFVGRNEMLSILPSDGAGRIGLWGNHDTRLRMAAEAMVGRDLDGDLLADVASIGIAPDGAAQVAVRMGRHGGGLSEPAYYDLDAHGASGIASGDFDKDGIQDLVVVTQKFPENGVTVLLGNRGGFSGPRRYPIELEMQAPYAVAVADLDGDGHLDIATSNIPYSCLPGDPDCSPPELGSVSILRGDGRGGFAAQVQIEGVAASPRAIAAADVTGDGRADLVVPHFGLDTFGLRLLASNADGGFADPVHLDTDLGPVAVVVADVTDDGFPDLLSLNHTAQSVSLLAGDGAGRFNPARHFPIQLDRDVLRCAPGCPWLWPWPWGLAVGDIDGDGAPDIVTANTDNGTLTVLRNQRRGMFSAVERVDTGGSPRAVALADVTGDGKVDVIAANAEGAISVHANPRN